LQPLNKEGVKGSYTYEHVEKETNK
jgi:hypothetical protein